MRIAIKPVMTNACALSWKKLTRRFDREKHRCPGQKISGSKSQSWRERVISKKERKAGEDPAFRSFF